MPVDTELKDLIDRCEQDYLVFLPYYQRMQRYYQNESDVVIEKSDIDTTSTSKIKNNYLKRFIKEEADYILANPITYINQDLNQNLEEIVKYQLAHWKKDHDKKLFRRALLYGRSFELYFIDKDAQFGSRIITPLEGYPYFEDEELKLFLHIFKKPLDINASVYMDVYMRDMIYHYQDHNFIGEDQHIFGEIPIGVCLVDDNEKDTLFEDIYTLQNAYEVNLSDLSHEITQYRQAYLKILNAEFDESDLPNMKKMGILKGKGDKVTIEWLVKQINDNFVMNTLKEIKQNMYELSSHINNNEQVPSNNSSLAMRTRQLALENKCKSNTNAMHNLIKDRIRFLFKYLFILNNQQFDYRLIEPKFTPSLPQDDLMMAQILSQVPESLISKKTARAQFSFIDNVSLEEQQVLKELNEEMTIDLDRVDDNG
ncbi:MAG: phage portal protein [Syntrophomonadaceae bacterium]|nr:phage portal protein [Syntrophomonadaceae bacterium]